MSFLSVRTALSWLTVLSALAASDTSHAQELGFQGPSYAGANSYPTGSKSESKLWWNDGAWWGCLWSESAQALMIHRLDASTETWLDTGTAVDPRSKAHSDCLWDGAKLYIATHQYTTGAGNPGHPLEVYRYSYDPNLDVYSLDVGFPTLIGDSSTEVMVVDKDSRGTLWAVWSAGNRIWFTHTLGDDRTWSVPALHPAVTSDLSGDDIPALVHFQGDKLGLLWSDQVTQAFYFSIHGDGEPDTLWSPVETVVASPLVADDHISLRAARDGRLFAALKTSLDEVLLAQRSAAGEWSTVLVTTAADDWTRPILVIDEQQRVLHLFATSPVIMGTIYEKTSPMDGLGFSAGVGVPVLRDAGGPAYNDATSTKQSLDGRTGLVVLASQQVTEEYGHHHDGLGGSGPTATRAIFSVDPQRGYAPLTAQFLDASEGEPTQWAWSFGDGGTSTDQHPRHTFAQAGRYSVVLRVTNGLGEDIVTRTDLIEVEAQPTSLRLAALADGQVREDHPDESYGGLATMRVRGEANASYRSYLKFFVPPLAQHVGAATLRLTCTDGSPDGGSVFTVAPEWDEPTLNWVNAPEIAGPPVGSLGIVTTGAPVALDLSQLVTGGGTVSLGIQSASSNSAFYSTRQGTAPGELELALEPAPPGPPTPGFEEARRLGEEPLMVQFFDASSGPVSSWSWDFGDGTTSELQNPAHVFSSKGAYTVSLTVTNASGSNTLVKPDHVRVIGHRGRRTSASPGLAPPAFLPLTVAGAGPCAIPSRLELRGSLEDVAGSLEDLLPELGSEIVARSFTFDGPVPRLSLELCGARLVLRPLAHDRVQLTLSPELR